MTLVWRPGYGGAAVSDPDAQAYLQAVEVADNQALEQGVQQAVNQFVIGCKADGIWSAIKASCILAGARTTNGALVPLVGAAPTPYNFDLIGNTDYNRKTGLKGDGSTKYLDSNRDVLSDPTTSSHISVYQTQIHSNGTAFGCSIGASEVPNTQTQLVYRASDNLLVFRSRDFDNTSYHITPVQFAGLLRNSPSTKTLRNGGVTSTYSIPAVAHTISRNFYVFAQNNGTPALHSNARLAFYSIGESIDLAKLDARVTALITAIGAAIP